MSSVEHSKTWLIMLLAFVAACSKPPAGRLRVVQKGDCYVDENKLVKFTGLHKTCYFTVQGWQDTPAQRQQLDSLAARAISAAMKTGLYEDCGMVYLQYNEEVNENSKHNDGTDSSLGTIGIWVAGYSWEKIGYFRGLYDERGRVVPEEAEGKPSVVVNAKLEMVANPTKP